MKKWPLLLSMASLGAILVGCAGSGVPSSTGGGSGGGSGGDGRSVASVNLPVAVPPLIDTYFLPGQGRVAGSPTAVIRRVFYDDINGGRAEDELAPDINLKLDDFNAQNRRVNAGLDFGENSRRFVNYRLEVQKMMIDNGDGTFQEFEGNNNNPILTGNAGIFNNALSLSVFNGRTTALQIYLNDAMLNHNGTSLVWDRNLFLAQNTNPTTGKITGFLSDYIEFDISNVASKPAMQSPDALGEPASRVYFSGDAIALAQAPAADPTTPVVFETLTPFGVIDGDIRFFNAPINKKQYELKQADPRFIQPPRLITAVKGFVRPYSEIISGAGEFEFITLPQNTDGREQDLVIVQRSSSAADAPIINMWFGEVLWYGTNSDGDTVTEPEFRAWPIDQLPNANRTGQIDGILPKAKLKSAGNVQTDTNAFKWMQGVREGDFEFRTPPAGLPAKFLTGRFIVFRR